MGKQVSQYDKILKENIEAVIPSLMQNVLLITAVETEELPDDIQHTKERKPDVLKKVTDQQGRTFILQVEFQVADEPEMVYRMADYYIMLQRRYKLPVEQFVIFLGAASPQMPAQLNSRWMQFSYSLIVLNTLDYRLFLRSTQPEEVVLGVLANFKGQPPPQVLRQIIQRIEESTTSPLSLQRYFQQLRVLAQLRNLEEPLKDLAMDSIAKYVSQERDVAYLAAQEQFVTNLLRKSDFSAEYIAELASVTVEFVKAIKQRLTNK
jgi:uncharacterized protein YeaC (DUF1315 family)